MRPIAIHTWLAGAPRWAQYLIVAAAGAVGAAPVAVVLALVGWPVDPVVFVVPVFVTPVVVLRTSHNRAPQ